MSEETSSSLIDTAVEQLTRDIVRCELVPEQKLLMADLKKRYGMGASPLREALARLTSQGFVTFDSGRGFRVASMSKDDLDDLTTVRQVLETTALRRSIELGDDEWEVGVVAAFTRLQLAVSRHGEDGNPLTPEIEKAHKQFHVALVAACRSSRLVNGVAVYHDQASRYRHSMIEQVHKVHSMEDFLQVHEALMKIVLSRDVEAAANALSSHLNLTAMNVYPDKVPANAGTKKATKTVDQASAKGAPKTKAKRAKAAA